jgi:hypothetical protein
MSQLSNFKKNLIEARIEVFNPTLELSQVTQVSFVSEEVMFF